MFTIAGRSAAALTLVAGLLNAGAALADNLALVIANSTYDNTANIGDAKGVLGLEKALNAAGYRVQTAENATRDELSRVLGDFSDAAAQADRLIVIFAGHLLTNGSETYLTPTDLKDPKPLTIALQAPALSSFLSIAADHAGGAGVFLGFLDSDGGFFGGGAGFRDIDGLRPGLGPVAVPQGVLLVTGPPDELVDALEDGFLPVGTPTATAVRGLDESLSVEGYVSSTSSLAPGEEAADKTPDEGPVGDPDQRLQAYWELARSQDTIAGYEDFLSRYPNGAFSELARTRIREMQEGDAAGRVREMQQAEADLQLRASERRQIQRDLTILDHDPRGVDGVFGPATRRAIRDWQAANGFDSTGYLNPTQLELLHGQALVRGDQLAEEAAKKAEAEREDDIRFWNQTGRSGHEADLRVYLRNYPDGVYAEEARAQLDKIEQARVEESQGPERAAWEKAKAADTVAAYQAYLRDYPNGLFAETAQERIAVLRKSAQDNDRLKGAKQEEDRLGLNTQAWRLIERRLDQLGLNPGKVDGKPTDQTRKAIRKYQSSAGLTVTGYMDRTTLSRLIVTIPF